MRIPRRLTRNPIVDAIAEVRFSSNIPNDAIIGLVYTTVQDTFGKPEDLPILQIPAALREKDPNLRYQACYRFTRPGNVLLIGPHNVALSTYPYSDWGAASPLLNQILSRLHRVGLFERIERIGLRYVNFFETLNVLDHSTLMLKVRDVSIAKESIMLRTETQSKGFTVITQIANRATAQVSGQSKNGSILDLDVVKDHLELKKEAVPELLIDLFKGANEIADSAFFNLLDENFVATFGPEY
jgi:uncharacterized protein (TIGR04255 family)